MVNTESYSAIWIHLVTVMHVTFVQTADTVLGSIIVEGISQVTSTAIRRKHRGGCIIFGEGNLSKRRVMLHKQSHWLNSGELYQVEAKKSQTLPRPLQSRNPQLEVYVLLAAAFPVGAGHKDCLRVATCGARYLP